MYQCNIKSKILKELLELTYSMWQIGWDESNGGNVSYILDETELKDFDLKQEGRFYELENIPKNFVGKYLLITASGSNFRVLKNYPTRDVGVIKFKTDGYEILWGFEEGRKPTSELYMHLLSHNARLSVDKNHRVIVHNHAENAIAYSSMVEPNDRDYTFPLWQVLTEGVVVFPDGVGVIPWELPGTEQIGSKTANKLLKSRIVVWENHGILASGKSYQDCFGLIETVNKACGIFIKTYGKRKNSGLTKENILEVCNSLNIEPRKDLFK